MTSITPRLLLPILLSAANLLPAAGGYHVLDEIKIGGEGGWDYPTVDSSARRLYLSHANKVVVVDIDAGKVVGEIPDTGGVHGIAIDSADNRGFTSNGRTNNVTIFDLKTLKPIGTVMTGMNPDAIQYDAASGKVVTFNGRSKDATVIDAKTGKVDGTVPLGGKPEFPAADGKGKIYANIEDTEEIVEFDPAKMMVTKRYSLKPCEEPSGLAMDTKGRRIFSVCDNKIMVISNPDTGKVIGQAPIGDRADGVAFDPSSNSAISSNGEGTITVVKETGGKWSVAETDKTKSGARTIALDTQTHKLYLPTAEMGPPPAPDPKGGKTRPTFLPNTFEVLVIGQ